MGKKTNPRNMASRLGFGERKERFKSEFNMGVADMDRMDFLLRRLIESAYLCRGGYLHYCPTYYSLLKQLYYELKRFMNKTQIPIFDEAFTEVEHLLDLGKDKRYFLPPKLDEIYENLQQFRQILGLGVPVSIRRKGIEQHLRG